MAKTKYDWARICTEYVAAPETISKQDLATKYGMSRKTLSRRAVKEQWDFQRDRFLAHVEEQTTEKRAEVMAETEAQWDRDMMVAAKTLREKALAAIDAGAKFRDVARALQIAQEIGKAATGVHEANFAQDIAGEIKKALA